MSRAILDSSPIASQVQNVAAPGVCHNRSLKRSASTASLLTPPATVVHKRHASKSRSHSVHTSDIDSDDEDDTRSTRRRLNFVRKRHRTEKLEAVLASLDGEDDDNPFWSRTSQSDSPVKKQKPSIRPPISPPPSRRQSSLPAKAKLSTPQTPDADPDMPVCDTPNNPFLDGSPMSVSGENPEPTTPTQHVEKPFTTYVYRGARATFANVLYGLTDEERAKSRLPLEHPDYSPDPICPPTRLFSDVISRKCPSSPTRQRSSKSRASSSMKSKNVHLPTEWDDSDDDQLHLTPPRILPQNLQ